jgi:hypothetical protein
MRSFGSIYTAVDRQITDHADPYASMRQIGVDIVADEEQRAPAHHNGERGATRKQRSSSREGLAARKHRCKVVCENTRAQKGRAVRAFVLFAAKSI